MFIRVNSRWRPPPARSRGTRLLGSPSQLLVTVGTDADVPGMITRDDIDFYHRAHCRNGEWGLSTEPDNPLLDEFVLSLSRRHPCPGLFHSNGQRGFGQLYREFLSCL
jgi:hypothetical protein